MSLHFQRGPLLYKPASGPAVPDLTANLIAFWELEEASGARADSHGSNDLTDVNTVGQATGKVGNCAEFVSANGECLSVADNADLGYSGAFSCVVWVYRTGSPNLLGKDGGYGHYEWRIISGVTGNHARFVIFSPTASAQAFVDVAAWTTNAWHMLCVTYDPATDEITISRNGGARSVADASAVTMARGNGAFRLGASTSVAFYSGRIDQVGFWKRALTTEEEAWLYNSGAGRSYAEIAATGA